MTEGTRGVDYLFGIILAVVVANYVAHFIHHDGESGRLYSLCIHHSAAAAPVPCTSTLLHIHAHTY